MYAAAYLLEKLGFELEADQKELEDFAVSIALGELEPGEITFWFEGHSRKA